MKEDTEENCDRAETHHELGVSDGILGNTIEADATDEGLKVGGGYSTFSWAWIERTRKIVIGADAASPSE